MKSVREGLVMAFLQNIVQTAHGFTKSQTVPLPTLLLLANMCLECSNTHVQYLVRKKLRTLIFFYCNIDFFK